MKISPLVCPPSLEVKPFPLPLECQKTTSPPRKISRSPFFGGEGNVGRAGRGNGLGNEGDMLLWQLLWLVAAVAQCFLREGAGISIIFCMG